MQLETRVSEGESGDQGSRPYSFTSDLLSDPGQIPLGSQLPKLYVSVCCY